MTYEKYMGDFTVDDIKRIIDTLESIFQRRTFSHLSAYEVLVRTILSQRTRDENTDKATEELLSIYPTMEDIANAPVD